AALHQPGSDATPAAIPATPPAQNKTHTRPQTRARVEPTLAPHSNRKPANTALPPCKTCGAKNGEVLYGKFGYYLKCDACQGNTAIRFTCLPNHTPRLRKAGLDFYRDCAECGSKELIHRNTAEPGQ